MAGTYDDGKTTCFHTFHTMIILKLHMALLYQKAEFCIEACLMLFFEVFTIPKNLQTVPKRISWFVNFHLYYIASSENVICTLNAQYQVPRDQLFTIFAFYNMLFTNSQMS